MLGLSSSVRKTLSLPESNRPPDHSPRPDDGAMLSRRRPPSEFDAMTRRKAAAIHLGISFLVVGTIACLIYFLWFPYDLIRIAGMDRLILTMLMVDIVAGPLLTFIVFKAHDMRLTRRDLTVIGICQAAFMGYALHTAWISRPVFLIWSVDHMYLMYANDIEPDDLAKGKRNETRTLSWTGPRLFAVDLPKEHAVRAKIIASLIEEQTSLERLPQYYDDYALQRDKLLRAAVPAEDSALPPWMPKHTLRDALADTGRPAASLRLVPIDSSRAASMLLIDAKTGSPIKTLSPPPPIAEPTTAETNAES